MNYNCSNLLDMRNLQEQVEKAFCYQKLFWPFTAWINCSSDLKKFANYRPQASNCKSFYRSLEQFFLIVGQNNFGKKIPLKYFFRIGRWRGWSANLRSPIIWPNHVFAWNTQRAECKWFYSTKNLWEQCPGFPKRPQNLKKSK